MNFSATLIWRMSCWTHRNTLTIEIFDMTLHSGEIKLWYTVNVKLSYNGITWMFNSYLRNFNLPRISRVLPPSINCIYDHFIQVTNVEFTRKFTFDPISIRNEIPMKWHVIIIKHHEEDYRSSYYVRFICWSWVKTKMYWVLRPSMEITVRITEITVIFSDLKNAVKCSKFCDYLYA